MIWLNVILIIIAIALSVAILLQSRSAGLGSAFGGASEGLYTRRGSEKRLHQITIIFATLFVLVSLAHLFWG